MVPLADTHSRIMSWWAADLACESKLDKSVAYGFNLVVCIYIYASPTLGSSSAWGSEMPPILGSATWTEISAGSCDLGVACPDVAPEFIAGSLFSCDDGRDHS